MSLTLYFSPDLNREIVTLLASRNGIAADEIAVAQNPGAKILVLSQEFLEGNGIAALQNITGIYLVLEQETDIGRFKIPNDTFIEISIGEINPVKLQSLIRSADLRHQLETLQKERDVHLRRLKELNNIGVALSTEKDPVKLLNMILRKSREITCADAGSLYLVEGDEETGKQLRFKISQNDSVHVNYEEFVMHLQRQHCRIRDRNRRIDQHRRCLPADLRARVSLQSSIRREHRLSHDFHACGSDEEPPGRDHRNHSID